MLTSLPYVAEAGGTRSPCGISIQPVGDLLPGIFVDEHHIT
jgi:hypothetical protein